MAINFVRSELVKVIITRSKTRTKIFHHPTSKLLPYSQKYLIIRGNSKNFLVDHEISPNWVRDLKEGRKFLKGKIDVGSLGC